MPEVHPGTDVEIPDGVPTSRFRCSIPNTKRYMKHNKRNLKSVCQAAHEGDEHALQDLLAVGDETNLFNGDLNEHLENKTPLMYASLTGQLECVELLLKAKADPHIKERMPHGKDPADGRTAQEIASVRGWDDVAEILKAAEKEEPYGWYVPEGSSNNQKVYGNFVWDQKPEKGWYSSRPGVAERNGYDPNKYGTGPYKQPASAFPVPAPPAGASLAETRREKARAALAAPAATPVPQKATLPVGLLFPGQGSQYVGMLSSCKDMPEVKAMLDKANDVLGYDILQVCLEGPDEKLAETRFCQPAMFIAGLAALEKLRTEREEAATNFQVAAGLSLGEYTALCAAGVFSFEDGLRLVQLRGQAMQAAASASKQAMLSVAGLEKGKLADLCKEAAKKEGGQAVCQIANELFPKGFSCAGTEAAIHTLEALAKENGALQARLLKTSGGFHTSLMAPAQAELGKALDEVLPKMKPPRQTVFMNVTGRPVAPGTAPAEIITLLKEQLTGSVLWEPSVRAMIQSGVSEFYECGPMKQLKAMMKRIDAKAFNATQLVEV
jgi:[acyl-carrier-protein] S-malonyltransferase